jgi:nucleoside-diphosphate-sugar epimerase
MADDRIIVVGCSGFVGRNTVKMLLQQGYQVLGFSRTDPKIDGMDFIPFDITDDENYKTEAFREATIINTAALTSNESKGNFERTNFHSVTKLLTLNPEGRFIHISSSSIYDLSKDSENIAETSFELGAYPFYNPYSEYKAKAEEVLLAGRVERTIHPISLRPHAIYGEDDTTLIPALKERVKNGKIFLPSGGRAKHSLTNIKNLLQAVQLGMSYTPTSPEAFNITDANPVSLAYAVKEALGEHIEVKAIPNKLLLSPVGKLLRVSEYEVRQLGYDRTYNLEKARSELNYEPTGFGLDWK